jgi:imidazolonepropionase-like amidohydrolase
MRFRKSCAICAAAILSIGSVYAQVATDQLAKAPAEAQQYVIVSPAGVHGQSALWTHADGTRMSRYSLLLRGMAVETDEAVRLGADGMPTSVVIRGFTPGGDVAETFHIKAGKATWKSQLDAGEVAYQGPELYMPAGNEVVIKALLIEALIASPTKTLKLLPAGRATAESLTKLEIGQGTTKKTVVCWAISGLSTSPMPIWASEDGRFFGTAQGMGFLPVGYAGELSAMMNAEDRAMAARSPALVKALLKTPAGPVAFTHVRAFLDGKRFVENQTVVIDKGLIVQVGPSASTPTPKGAEVIDGKGRTLVPGLWESHMHVSDDYTGPYLLSLGVTSARDPGNDDAQTLARVARRAKGELLMPNLYASSMIDGRGPNTAQVANVATSLEEALAQVRKAKASGFSGVKLYGSFNPAWVAPTAAEAHRLGLHVHGHVPAGMLPHEAIAAGYDELTHLYFVAMEAMPKDVVNTSNGMNRFEGPGRYAKTMDLNADPMKSLIATMAKRGIVSDPTLVVVEGIFVPEYGDLSPAFAPYLGTLPPATERGFREGGFTVPKDLTRADYRKSFDKMLALVGAMHKAGVPIVAGTDSSGLELVHELELYVRAGFTPEEALAAATLVPARLVGAEHRTGSITVGKAADLLLVEGNPSQRIGDLRNTRLVMMDGKLMDADALRTAAGFSGRPKMGH